MRQNTGIAWAFGVFWPRAAHPFAPAAWTVRAVPELVHHIEHLLNADRRTRILLHAQSIGTVIAVSALLQIPAELRPRVALLTTGSPIRTVFRRHYPGYVTAESLGTLVHGDDVNDAKVLRAWVNVCRRSDPLAGSTRVAGVDEKEWADGVDPDDGVSHARTLAQPVFWPLERHNGYRRDPRIAKVRRDVLRALAEPDPPAPPSPAPPTPRRPTPAPAPGAGLPDGAV
jgi:hypothetical protein